MCFVAFHIHIFHFAIIHLRKVLIYIFDIGHRPTYKKVFETVRSASRNTSYPADANQFPRIGSMTVSTISNSSTGPRMSCGQPRPVASIPGVDSTGHSDSEEFEDYP